MRSPLNLNSFLYYHNLRSRPICPKSYVLAEAKIPSDVWGHGPTPLGSASDLTPELWTLSCFRHHTDVVSAIQQSQVVDDT